MRSSACAHCFVEAGRDRFGCAGPRSPVGDKLATRHRLAHPMCRGLAAWPKSREAIGLGQARRVKPAIAVAKLVRQFERPRMAATQPRFSRGG